MLSFSKTPTGTTLSSKTMCRLGTATSSIMPILRIVLEPSHITVASSVSVAGDWYIPLVFVSGANVYVTAIGVPITGENSLASGFPLSCPMSGMVAFSLATAFSVPVAVPTEPCDSRYAKMLCPRYTIKSRLRLKWCITSPFRFTVNSIRGFSLFTTTLEPNLIMFRYTSSSSITGSGIW
jgi:hypothetical protein